MRLGIGSGFLIGAAVGLSCTSRGQPAADVALPEERPRSVSTNVPTEPSNRVNPPTPPPPVNAPTARQTHVAILDPAHLLELEANGFALGQLVSGVAAKNTRELDEHPGFHSVFQVLKADLAETRRVFPLARVTSMMGFRLFDASWLASDETRFELTGVFNRLDRRAFYAATCGEIRFTYRLQYQTEQGGEPMTGRLPMTVNLVFLVEPTTDDQPCSSVARAWQSPDALSSSELRSWLRSEEGPLGKEMQTRWRLKSVETNLQTIRLQSTVHTSLAGHIEYSLRVFHPEGPDRTSFLPAPLENTPDVARLRQDAALRGALLEWLKQPATLAHIDRGTLQIPERFLARRATSFSPRALTRRGNRPFLQLFEPSDFANLDGTEYQTIRSPRALLRRLDAATCTGCHQSRSIAGFHFVGMDGPDTPSHAALLHGGSTHLQADLARRQVYTQDIAEHRAPDEFRPIPERQGAGTGFGAPCGLGDPGFSDWTCSDGFRCQELEDPEVGVCLDEDSVGAPCEYGVMHSKDTARHDRVGTMKLHSCGPSISCDRNYQGFPLGSCGATCSVNTPTSICGFFLDIDGYQNCFRSGRTVRDCESEFVFATRLRACDASTPCRQDFVCVQTNESDRGACVPPYFVFPLRNDGYPLPR